MQKTNWDILLPLAPAIISGIFGIIMVRTVNKRFKKYEISFSGIFKERIDVYRGTLERLFKSNKLIFDYYNSSDTQIKEKTRESLNDFSSYLLVNQPYITDILYNLLLDYRELLSDTLSSLEENKGALGNPYIHSSYKSKTIRSAKESYEYFLEESRKIESLIIIHIRMNLGIEMI
ncbi:hypothetical protein [Limnovirga soli]|uniref:Uncharacterized protein n=1 Tax=Limnovirga soli TaxID=2656915 RepID=A0A8J8FFQ1_9BACT|nr:hypothetical protein [Limnovirga soli]NNV57210.1 hypothetical protein [Limnovirga soli]